jgi:hypothetical protein
LYWNLQNDFMHSCLMKDERRSVGQSNIDTPQPTVWKEKKVLGNSVFEFLVDAYSRRTDNRR